MYCITFQHSCYKNFGRVAISMPGLGPTSRVRVRICKVHFKCRRETFTAGQVHNNGVPTYCSGNVASSPDVTLSTGLFQ